MERVHWERVLQPEKVQGAVEAGEPEKVEWAEEDAARAANVFARNAERGRLMSGGFPAHSRSVLSAEL